MEQIRNHDEPVYYPGEYNTDLVKNKSLDFLDDAADNVNTRPFFLFAMPIGPHTEVVPTGN
ncbi:hypothetical protein FCULG_00009043 [Fusarium culmorum]|uniref:Sulfatase N-terminal domain-containing protein n=1 Tax=Fusarium culmorum TaxID=5516 RepID=A0A2T4GHM6_FUSCU|nr:hypothetical protein FCULG_00009043 [Fusarium culmorum]